MVHLSFLFSLVGLPQINNVRILIYAIYKSIQAHLIKGVDLDSQHCIVGENYITIMKMGSTSFILCVGCTYTL